MYDNFRWNMKIAIIANCQVQPLAKMLSSLGVIDEVVSIPVHLYGTQHFDMAVEKFKAYESNPEFVVLSFINGEKFGEFETVNLKNRIQNLHTITNIHFSGLHPDITYLGDQAGRIESSLGDYHSKIILHSFLTNCSINEPPASE